MVQALIDDLIDRASTQRCRVCLSRRLEGASPRRRRSFERHTLIQRCQIHKARKIMERLSPALHQTWELDDAAKAEKPIRNLAQRLERDAPDVSKSFLERLDESLTGSRLGRRN